MGSRREDQPYLLMSGTAWEVSGTFLATRKRKTVWARSTLMATVHFWPPAVGDPEAFRAGLPPHKERTALVLLWCHSFPCPLNALTWANGSPLTPHPKGSRYPWQEGSR